MKQLIFLDRHSLDFLDYALVSDFELVVDMVVNQKSNFTLNKESIKANIGDIAVFRAEGIEYIGIVESFVHGENKTTQVQLNDFKEVFNVQVPIEGMMSLNYYDLCSHMESLINKYCKDTNDKKEEMSYIEVESHARVIKSMDFESDSFVNILDFMNMLIRNYGLVIRFKMKIESGKFSKVIVVIERSKVDAQFRYDIKAIRNLEVRDSTQYAVNKCVFYPRMGNTEHRETVNYYLLKDGTITQESESEERFNYVSTHSEFYLDKEYNELESKAKNTLIASSRNHEITFDLYVKSGMYIPLNTLFVGSYVVFYTKENKYTTLLTQIKYGANMEVCRIVLGEHRSSLTDKIKLLTAKKDGEKIN